MQPLFNRVFVLPIAEEQKSASGLIIPHNDFLKGKILFAGPTCESSLIPNIEVLYQKDQGSKYNYKGQDGLFFFDKDLITIL